MTSKILLNNFLFETEDIIINVKGYSVQGGAIIVVDDNNTRHYISIVEYMTYIFNKLKP